MNDWTPEITIKALAMRVLAVATTRVEGAWCAYIDAVPGQRHRDEYQAVLDHGEKLREDIARVMFPRIDLPYAL
jgi:hypothetical protein